MADDANPFTPKQAAFITEYVRDRCGARAAVRAGYSPNSARQTAYDLLHKPEYAHVQEAIAIDLEAREAQKKLDLDWVVIAARELYERSMDREDSRGAAAALSILAKHVGIGNKPTVTINADLDKLTDDQLEHLANGGNLTDLPR